MGEVYEAIDTNLKRSVAIKVLPMAVAGDAGRLGRFQREAELLAALNHPNIAAIYGLERLGSANALVMELVEGPTLAERIRGGISVDEALSIARQIAEALEAAHEQGIIHRDLKPDNIKVRADGIVKVLDFGLAKALAPAASDAGTVTVVGTAAGVIMGTAPYMSPEQVRGEVVGRQTDIWSFGVVLYEMLTGVSPFSRDTSAETVASVLETHPDFSMLPSNTPANARRLLRRCLEKDRRRRLQHIGDARIEIEEALAAASPDTVSGPPGAVAKKRRWPQAAGVIALSLLAGTLGWFLAKRSPSDTSAAVVRLSLPFPVSPSTFPVGMRHLAISEDGSRIAYASGNRLWIRRLDNTDAVAIEQTTSNPFFSPNGEWVGFFGDVSGLQKVPALGGPPVQIAATPGRPGGGTWRADGTIVFATSEGLYQVSDDGGQPRLLVKPNPSRNERLYAWPQFMPDGWSVLFTIVPLGSIEGAQIAVLNLQTLEIKVVLKGASAARYAATGHLVYASGSVLKASAFDANTQHTLGEPVSLPDVQVSTTADNGAAEFVVSAAGTLLFLPPDTARIPLRTLAWVDRHGNKEPLPLAPDRYADPRVSPDGTRIALDITGANRDIWIWNLQRPSLTKLTSGPSEDILPVWSRDSRRVFFASDRTRNFDVYSQAADGATAAQVEFAGPGTQMTISLTPDGTRLLLTENFKDVSMLTLGRPDRLEPVVNSQAVEILGQVSPDGNWVAYESDESGEQFEIYLRPFPNTSGRREKISINGGRFPLWGPQSTGELFYVDLTGAMMAASVKLSPQLSLGRVTKLFDSATPPRGPSGMPYDISPADGRFLMTFSTATTGPAGINISVVLNWFTELQRLVPGR